MNFLFHYMARWKAVNWTRYHQIFTHLANMGHQVYVLQPPSSNMKETNFQEIEVDLPKNLHLIDVEVNPNIWNRNFPLNKLVKKGYYATISKKRVKEIVKKHNIDVLFLYNIPQYGLMNGNGCIKVFDFADDYIEMLKHELGKFSNPLILKIADNMLNDMIKRSDLTLAVSNVLKNTINHGNGDNIKVLPNGASLEDFIIKESDKKSHEYKKPVIGFIGAFEYFIDFDLILDIAEKLSNMTFLLVGGGREFDRVKNEINRRELNNIILTGSVPHSEIAKYIDKMDICLNVFKLIPVSHGACPLKLFEYLLMKKPVISNRLEEVKLIDKDFIFYADKTNEFVSQVNLILNNEKLRNEYAERGYKIAVEEYTWKSIAENLVKLIEEVKKSNVQLYKK